MNVEVEALNAPTIPPARRLRWRASEKVVGLGCFRRVLFIKL